MKRDHPKEDFNLDVVIDELSGSKLIEDYQQANENICVQVSLVCFVQHDYRVTPEQKVGLKFAQQNAVCHTLNPCFIVHVTLLVAYLKANAAATRSHSVFAITVATVATTIVVIDTFLLGVPGPHPRLVELMRDALRRAHGGHTARLRDTDHARRGRAFHAVAGFEKKLRHLRRLAASSLAANNHN